MNYPFSDKKALFLLILGLSLCVIGIIMMLLLRFYAGLFLLVPLSAFYVYQLVVFARGRRNSKK